MFTGTGKENSPLERTGFATKSSYLRTLVATYHHGAQKVTFPFALGEHTIADLNINEFISNVYLVDEQGRRILRQDVHYKFPYTSLIQHLPNARYITLNIHEDALWAYVVKAVQDMKIIRIDSEEIGMTSLLLGAGRLRKGDPIDMTAGIVMHIQPGDSVSTGDNLMTLYSTVCSDFSDAAVRALNAIDFESVNCHKPLT